MVDAGGPGSVRKCPGAALADLGDVEGFDRSGEKDQLYALQLSDGVYKRKMFTPSEGIRSLKFEELSDVDISHAVPRRLHSLAFTGEKWVAFADPVQQTGYLCLLEIVLGDGPDDFVDVLHGFKLKWPQYTQNQRVGIRVIVQETPQVLFTLEDIQGEADFHLLNIDKLFIGPVSLKRFRFTPGELSFDQTAVIIGQ